jgi:ribosomal protein L11 methyltransferase
MTREPSRWFVLSAAMPPPGEEFLMVDALRRLGARAVEREGERVIAWMQAPADIGSLISDVRATLRASTSIIEPHIAWRWQSHDEWAERWLQAARPRRVTDRITVTPIGHEPAPHDSDVIVRLGAGMAFGTAEHATTRGCLRLLERLLRVDDRVLDIGTGSGVLAIAAALLGAREVLALEADALACDSARRNVAANDVTDRVEVRELTVDAEELRRIQACDMVLANLESGVLHLLLPGLRAVIEPGGVVIVAGATAGEQAALLAAAAAAGFVSLREDTVDGWTSVALVRG